MTTVQSHLRDPNEQPERSSWERLRQEAVRRARRDEDGRAEFLASAHDPEEALRMCSILDWRDLEREFPSSNA